MKKQNEQTPVRYRRHDGGHVSDFYFERSLDLIFSPGTFTVEIVHTCVDVGLPIVFCGDEHYIVGTLIVTDSGTSLPMQTNRTTGQILSITSCESRDTKLYTRTFANGMWSEWRSLAYTGMYDSIDSTDELLSTVEGLVAETKVLRTGLSTEVSRSTRATDENCKAIADIKLRTLDKKLPLTEIGYYASNGLDKGNGEKAKNTGLVAFRGYEKLVCLNDLAGDAYAVAFFDAGGNLLKDISIKAGTAGWLTRNIDLTNEEYAAAEYLAVSCYDATGTFAQFDAVLTNPESIEQRLSQVEAKTDFELEDIIEKQAPLTETGFYDLRGNKNNASNSMNTGIVPVNGYKRLEYRTNLAADAAAVLFYDTTKMLITALSVHGTSGFETKILDLTEEKYANIGYVRVSCYDGTGSFAKFDARLYNDNTLEYRISSVERLKEIMPSNDRPLNILIFGDSITDSTTISVNGQQQTTSYKPLENGGYITDESGATVRFSMWPHLITKYISCFDVRNYAKAGASYREISRSTGNERQNLSYQIQLALNDKSNPNGVFPTAGEYIPDIVIFALGTNDGTPTGSYDETMSKTIMSADGESFDVDATLANLDITITCDAIRYAFLKIKQAFPQSLCLCVLPIQRADSEQPRINEVLERMARRYSIKVIDGAAELGIVRDLEVSSGKGACLKDGLHPNDKGHKLFTRMVVNAIKNNWIEL